MRLRSFALLLAAALAPGPGPAAAAEAPLAGWWMGEAEHLGSRSPVFLHLVPEGDGLAARLGLPAIGGWEIPLGPARREGEALKVGRSWTLALAAGPAGPALRGALPEGLVPVHRLEVTFRPVAPPSPPAAPAWVAPRPAVRWTAEVGAPVWAGVALDRARGRVLVATDGGQVVALEARTGRRAWSAPAGAAVRGRPAVAGDTAYVAADDGAVLALDAATGRLRWRTALPPPLRPRAAPGAADDRYERYGSAVVVAGDRLLVGGRDGALHALDRRTGAPRWRAPAGDAVLGAPAVAAGLALYASMDGRLRAVGLADGRPRWERDLRAALPSDVVVAGGRALVGSRAYELSALEVATGAVAWQRYLWFSWIESPPALGAGVAFHGSSDALRVYAVEAATGRERWAREVPGWSWAQPALDAGAVYAGTVGSTGYLAGDSQPRRGALVALARGDGALRWLLPAAPAAQGEWGFAAAPAADGGRVYAADLAGRVYAVEAGTTTPPAPAW